MNDIAKLMMFMAVVRPFPKTGVLINLFESCHHAIWYKHLIMTHGRCISYIHYIYHTR